MLVWIFTPKNIYKYMHIRIYTYVYTHRYICIYVYLYIYIYIYIFFYVNLLPCAHSCINVQMWKYMYEYLYIYIKIYIYLCLYKYKRIGEDKIIRVPKIWGLAAITSLAVGRSLEGAPPKKHPPLGGGCSSWLKNNPEKLV